MTDRRYRDEFTPTRNRLTCEAFLKEAQKDPAGAIGKSIVFSVNQTHATNLTKIFNELHPGIALTITSRIPDALAKWRNRDEGPNSYGVPIEKIRENDWSLAAGRYKPVTAEPVHYDNPRRIVAEVLALEARITEKLTRLQGMVQ